jgi:two-component system phosphate regulon response regulator PhoB
MILAKKRMMGPTLRDTREAAAATLLTRETISDVSTRTATPTHMEIIFRLPAQKGAELMRLMQDSSRAEGSPIVLWAGPHGEVDIIVRDTSATTEREAKALLSARAECKLPAAAPVMPTERDSMEAGEWSINPGRHEVKYRKVAIPQLTYTEFGILHFLARHAGWVFSREQIVEGVKGRDYPVTDRAVDVQVAGLRKKLGAAADHIQTVRGVGYRFKD